MSVSPGQRAEEVASSVFGTHFAQIKQYVDILTSRGIDWGLIGPREVPRMWERHILNSVALMDLVPDGASLVDVGSGAGLPGIPLAVLREDIRVALLEPLLRRANFLSDVIDELGLVDRVSIERARAEEHSRRYDVVAARALAPLPRLITWCAPLLERDGIVLALKGAAAEQEVTDSAPVLKKFRLTATVLQVRAHPQAESTSVVRITR